VSVGKLLRWIVRRATNFATYVAIIATTSLMVVTTVDVLSRLLRNRAIPGASESGVLLMVSAIFLGLAYAERQRSHVSMTLVTSRLPVRAAIVVRALSRTLGVVVLAWVVYATSKRGIESFQLKEFEFGLMRFPIWPARLLIPLSLIIFLGEVVLNIADDARQAWLGIDHESNGTGGEPPVLKSIGI
jgi:TRAP-type transport system small permease protein